MRLGGNRIGHAAIALSSATHLGCRLTAGGGLGLGSLMVQMSDVG